MFSTKPIETFKQQLIALTPDDETKLAKYLLLIGSINSKDKVNQAKYLKDLEKYSDLDIYKFCENNPIFRNFIQSPDCPLTRGWPEYLKEKGCIGENLTSLDGNIKHSLYDEYMGAYLYSEYNKNKKNDKASAANYLDLACEFKFFQALRSRCILCQHKLSKTNDDREGLLAVGQILHDTALLCKLYGSTGYFESAKFLLSVGNHYSNLSEDEFASTASYFHKLAAEYFFSGKELLLNHQLPDNEKILGAICKEAGLLHFGFKSWDSAEEHFLEPVIESELSTRQEMYTAGVNAVKKLLTENKDKTL